MALREPNKIFLSRILWRSAAVIVMTIFMSAFMLAFMPGLGHSASAKVAKNAKAKPEAKPEAKAEPEASPVAKDARVGGDLKLTVFVADLSDPVNFHAFTLADPHRVIIDLPEVKFQMPADQAPGSNGKGLIGSFRYGLFAPGKSRIVIDVIQPVKIEKAFVREPENGFPARLVIHLAPASREEFLNSHREGGRTFAAESPQKPAATEGSVAGAEAKSEGSVKLPVIVLDPGHGGIDPGTVGRATGTPEKAVVFAFASELKKRLEAHGRFKVVMTRDTDTFIPLDDRMALARTNTADLFISIHADALDAKTAAKAAQEVRGATVYTLSEEASDDEASASAARENRSDLVAGLNLAPETRSEVSVILLDLVGRETKNNSVSFARNLIETLKGKAQFQAKSHRFANFRVLKAPDVPSVLFELGYLSHPEDEKLLTSEEWRSSVAEVTSQAIATFFNKRQVRLPF
jgi:N-acetylmuramoyl-L-alanine amidase